MIKKILLSAMCIIPFPFISVSCSQNKTIIDKTINWKLVCKNYLDDADAFEHDNSTNYRVVTDIDKIISPESIAVEAEGYDLLTKIKFIKDNIETFVRGSSKVSIESSNKEWEISNEFLITSFPKDSETDITIKVGSAKEVKIHAINRKSIINRKLTNWGDMTFNGLKIGTTSVNEITFGMTIDSKNYESANIIYSDSNNDPTKRVNIFANVYNDNKDKRIEVDGTVGNIAMLVYLDEQFEGKDFWPRTAWNINTFQTVGNIGDISPYNYHCVDFSNQHNVAHKGWNLFSIPHEATLDKHKNYLSLFRFIQMKNSTPSGTIHIAGIFESDEEMKIEDLIKLVEK